MDNESLKSQDKIMAFIAGQVKAGLRRDQITQKLVEQGIESSMASRLVDSSYNEIRTLVEHERMSVASLIPAFAGAVVAALVGGFVWTLTVNLTGYEIGYMAWGIGLLCGYSVVLFSGGKKGVTLQSIAVLSSLIGIMIGKYGTFLYSVKEAVREEYGAEAVAEVPMISASLVDFFVDTLGSTVDAFDGLWVVLAVFTAWKIPKGFGARTR